MNVAHTVHHHTRTRVEQDVSLKAWVIKNLLFRFSSLTLLPFFVLIPDQVCKRPWNFERVPNSIIQGHDRALIFTSTKEACLAACLNEVLFFKIDFEVSSTLLKKFCRLVQQFAETIYFS